MPTRNNQKKPDLSIIVTAHAEGILLHRTLRSLQRATKPLQARFISYEILVHVDNGTSETLDYINSNQAFLSDFQIYYNCFKDLGTSRNFMISKAQASLVAVVDADDLFSENWFSEGYKFYTALNRPAVLHTEWLINFGDQNLACRKYSSKTKDEDAINMVWANRWDSAVIAPKEVFEKFPYAANLAGFGSEDWHFGSETLSANIPHYVVPKTVIFARRKEISEMSIQRTDHRTVHYTNLLDVDYFKNIVIPEHIQKTEQQKTKSSSKDYVLAAAKKSYHILARSSTLKRALETPKKHLQKFGNSVSRVDFPDWLIEEWRAMHDIDRQVFPTPSLLNNMPLYISEMYELGIAYHKLLQYVTSKPDYIIMVPHLVAGGADLVVLNYARALKKLHPNWHILVIATDNTPSPWADRLPQDVDYMPWGEVCLESGIWQDLHLQLFARLIVQLQCKRLHIIQSSLGFEFAAKYRSLLSNNDFVVYACAFCEDIDDEGRFIGHIHSGLPGAYPVINKVLTDNADVIKQLVHEYGYEKGRFEVHYQPAEVTSITPPKNNSHKPFRILWASRVSTQKRPDILIAVAKQLNPQHYHIDAYGSLHNNYNAAYFDGLEALTYKGAFSGIESLPVQNYDAFLYTSANDGVPNVLLGIAAAGLPIIASDSGGVGEFISDHRTGILITPIESVESYVSAIKELSEDYNKARDLAMGAQKILVDQHGVAAFYKRVEELG